MLSREEREIESMVAQIEQKQKRLNELEGLMSGLYEKQQMLLNAPDDYTTPPMSKTMLPWSSCSPADAMGATFRSAVRQTEVFGSTSAMS